VITLQLTISTDSRARLRLALDIRGDAQASPREQRAGSTLYKFLFSLSQLVARDFNARFESLPPAPAPSRTGTRPRAQ
jgi:hypothetical protein